MKKHICIHGHFYQPPRENAWLEAIEQQDSAYPYHDWNERINAECYGPNSASRILNGDHRIVDIVNNYSRISFNFGPTLLSWMEKNSNEIYQAILKADQKSMDRFSGHGSAIAQVYNHIIMPLANLRDKETQVKWGIKDFQSRFNRRPEGMWLAETAVDTETLEVLAENDISYTILAPRQIKRFRKVGASKWLTPADDPFFHCRPYKYLLPSGKEINLFFYNGEVSQSVAFSNILDNGKLFAKALYDSFIGNENDICLTHIATDGESYGHHHKHGDMALAFCLKEIEENKNFELTNYGEFLSKHTPEYEAEIHENSSWSCVHGVERWKADCGCNSGGKPGWHQKWREPLRTTLDELREKLIQVYKNEMPFFCNDIWYVRNEFISVLLDRNEDTVSDFITKHAVNIRSHEDESKFLRLLEMQRNAMLMYTSCGWFFDDISGIETVQILQYANRAIQLAERESDVFLNEWFKKEISKAESNTKKHTDGKKIYEAWVEPKRLTLSNVAAHYAVATLFSENPERIEIWNYIGISEDFERHQAGDFILSVGRTVVHSKVTHSMKNFDFAVLYLGQSHIIGSMAVDLTDKAYLKMKSEIVKNFNDGQLSDTIALLQKYFGQQKFSIWNLFRDDQRAVLLQIVENRVENADEILKDVYNRNYNLMGILHKANLPLPILFQKNKEAVVNHEIISCFKGDRVHPSQLENLVVEFKKWEVPLDKTQIEFVAGQRVYSLIKELVQSPDDLKLLRTIRRVMDSLEQLEVKPDLVPIQDKYYQIYKALYSNDTLDKKLIPTDYEAWDKLFRQIGDSLNMDLFKTKD
ncbi:MAG: DUF3536 domain-containing protein [Chitinophagales bacterium]|nr:DUF3536 domain-containing protein [Chitinophagales bacterium]